MDFNLRTAEENDFLDVHKFVSNCKPLESYPEHFYKIILRYFGNTCFIVEHENKIIGLTIGFISQVDNRTYFMWQIGVDLSLQKKGVGKTLLNKVENEIKKFGCNKIELTVDPENIPSQSLFRRNGYINVSSKEGEIIKILGKTAVKDYYKPGRHFILFEKKLK